MIRNISRINTVLINVAIGRVGSLQVEITKLNSADVVVNNNRAEWSNRDVVCILHKYLAV